MKFHEVLRSSGRRLPSVPASQFQIRRDRVFSEIPRLWNDLPEEIRLSECPVLTHLCGIPFLLLYTL